MTGPVPIARPSFGPEEEAAAREVLRSGWIGQGPRVRAFEEALRGVCGAPRVVAVSSGTTAIELALRVAGVGPGDEVVVPAFTFVATANAVEAVGATAVFADIDPETFNLAAAAADAAMTARARALMPVHQFGCPADMAAFESLARRKGCALIEDAACALGTMSGGRPAGAWGDAACFSFHPRKVITTGEGGAVATGRHDWAETIVSLRNHGAAGEGFGDFPLRGHNYRMTDLQAAIGVEQLRKLPRLLARRRELANRYDGVLSGIPWLKTPAGRPGHSYQAYVCMVGESVDRDALIRGLEGAGVATRPGTHAAPALTHYRKHRGARPEAYPNAWAAHRRSIALPLFGDMTEAQQDRVVEALRNHRP